MSKALQQCPDIKHPSIQPKKSGKLLTSIENLKIIEEKEKKERRKRT